MAEAVSRSVHVARPVYWGARKGKREKCEILIIFASCLKTQKDQKE